MILKNAFFARHNFKHVLEIRKRTRIVRKRMFDRIENAIINDRKKTNITKSDFLFYNCESQTLFDIAKNQDYYFKNKGYGFEVKTECSLEKIVISW